jgi:hypothetical protein
MAGLAALALLLSACYVPLAEQHQQHHPNTRPWWCHSMGGEGTHGAQHYLDQGIQKGMLSWADCLQVSENFDNSLRYALQWPTRGEAEADGWAATVNYATGMGTHHARGNPLQGSFDPNRPNFLQYDGNGPDAKLVGMSWYVDNGPDAPPAGFAGNNDWWHTHEYLCISNTSGLVIRDGQCGANQNGTTVYLGNFWMVHAWIVPGWTWPHDVFIGHHPCLLPGGPAAEHDPCWEMHGGHMEAARFEPVS